MRRSERKKVKLLMLKYVSQKVDAAKEDLAATWPCKGVPGARKTISVNIKILHGALFVQRAVEKQIPMPVKMQVGPYEDMGYFYDNDKRVSKCSYKAICQNCNNTIDTGAKYFGVRTITINQEKYCPRCGQKLWWPK